MGQEATEFVKTLLKPDDEVRLEFDVQERDKHGRLLAYVYFLTFHQGVLAYPDYYVIGKEHNEIFLNATIIKAGYATPMNIPPDIKYADLFKELYEEAIKGKMGLWKYSNPYMEDSLYCGQDGVCFQDGSILLR